jgi:hypothetical protein
MVVSMNKQLPNYSKNEINDCSICLDAMEPSKDDSIKLVCGHIFHKHCIEPWKEINTCPLCRSIIDKSKISVLKDRDEPVCPPLKFLRYVLPLGIIYIGILAYLMKK